MSIVIKSGSSASTMIVNPSGEAHVAVLNKPEIQLYSHLFRRKGTLTPFGTVSVDETTRLVGPAFVGTTLDANFWTTTLAGGGTVSLASNQAIVRTNGAVDGSAILTSVRKARYIPGHSNYFSGCIRLNSLDYNGNTKRWGLFTSTTDGYYFEFSENTFYVVTKKASVAIKVASGSFNGDLLSITMDILAHDYEIHYDSKYVWFVFDGQLVHITSGDANILSDTLNFSVQVSNTNTAGSAIDTYIEVTHASILRKGKENTSSKYVNITTLTTTVLKRGPGRLKRIIINTAPAAAGTLVIHDNTSAIAPIVGSMLLTGIAVKHIDFDLDFHTGLTIVTAVSAGDITVVYD